MVQKSTNVRSTRHPARGSWRAAVTSTGLRAVFGTVGRIAPGAAGELAERLFFSPPRSRGTASVPLGAEELAVTVDGRPVAAWRCGSGPAVILMHGWGGSSAQLGRLVPPLLQRGFSVVGLDAPAHGRTPGRRASLPEFARALAAVAQAVGPVHALVGHSLGAAAAALAVSGGVVAQRLVLVGVAADPARWARIFAARFGIPPAVMDSMGRSSERRLRFRWSELHVGRLLHAFGGRVLFVHDRDDRETRWSEAFDVAAHLADTRVVLTAGLGHRRILAHAGVAGLIAEFVQTGEPRATAGVPLAPTCATPGCGRPAAGGEGKLCGGCALDHHLFQRETSRWPSAVLLG
jgi:pimeloyl-ACP methyl ester carboxylesterase